jgi:hypothetical protein
LPRRTSLGLVAATDRVPGDVAGEANSSSSQRLGEHRSAGGSKQGSTSTVVSGLATE